MSFLNHAAPNYTQDRAETIFAQALRHIDSECIQEFLYPPQQTHLQLLQRILMQPLCQALTMSIATITASDAPSLNELVHCVTFPSFTIGPLSVMYHISEHVRSNVSPYKSPYIARCVRDDEHGTYLVFAELDTGLTEVDVIIQHSPGVREHVSLVVKNAPFRDLMENMAKGRVYDARVMRDALVFTARINQIRPCPSCGRQSISCGCSLNLVRKRYPVDFTTDLANLTSYMGDYEGLCCQAMYENGVNLCTWTSRVGVMGGFSSDSNGTRKLESWAMWNTLQGRENLLKLAMPDVGDDAQPTEYVDEADRDAPDNIDRIAERVDVSAQRFTSHDIGTPSEVQRAQYMAQNIPPDEVPTLEASSVRTVPQSHPVPSGSSIDGIAERRDALAQRFISHDIGSTSEMERAQYMAENVPSDEVPPLETRSVRTVPRNYTIPSDNIDGIAERDEALAQRSISPDIGAPSEMERAQHVAQDVPSDDLPTFGTGSVRMVPQNHPVPSDNIDGIGERAEGLAQHVISHDTGAPSAQYVVQNVPSGDLPALGTSSIRTVRQDHPVPSRTTFSPVPCGIHQSTNRHPGISSLGHVSTTDVIDCTQSIDRVEQLEVPQPPRAVIASTTGAVQQPHPKAQGQTSTAVDKEGIVKRKRMGRPPAPPRRRVKQLTQILPTMSATDGGCEGGEEEETKPNLDAMQKLELRKARNRESAVRSNERKKREIQALEDNLTEAKGREEVLRQELEGLTAENLALRGMLED